MAIDETELSDILKEENLTEEEFEKIKEIILDKEDKDYDKIMEELDTLNISNPKKIVENLKNKISDLEKINEEKGKLNKDIDGRFAQLKISESEFDKNKTKLLNANNKEEKLSGNDEIDHVTGLKDKFMTKLLIKRDGLDIDIIKRIFRKLSVSKLIKEEAEDDQTQHGEVYYYYLNIDSNKLNELFNNISRSDDDKDVKNILKGLDDSDEQKKLKEDLIHIFNSPSDNKKIFKIPEYFIEKFIEIAINTRSGEKYEKEHLEGLERIIEYDDGDKKLETLDDTLKDSKKKIEDEYNYLKGTIETINQLSEEVNELQLEVNQLKNTKENMGNEDKLKETREKIITKNLEIELENMKRSKAQQAIDEEKKKKEEVTRESERAENEKIERNIEKIQNNFSKIKESYGMIVEILASNINITEKITKYKETDGEIRIQIINFNSVTEDAVNFTSIKENRSGDIAEMEEKSKKGIISLLEKEINRIEIKLDKSKVDENMELEEFNIISSEIDSISDLEHIELDAGIKKDMKKSIDELIKKKDEEKNAIAKRSYVFSKDFRFGDIEKLDIYFKNESKYSDFYKLFGGSRDKSPWVNKDPKEAMRDCIIIPFINYAKNNILQHKIIGKINSLKIPDLKTLSEEEISLGKVETFATDPSMKRYFTRRYKPISATGIFYNSIYYILDQLFITPQLVLSKALADGTSEETDPLDKILTKLSGGKLKELLKRPQIKINNDRDTRLFNIEMSDSFLELQHYEPKTAESLKEKFKDPDNPPDSFHLRTFIDLLESMVRAQDISPEELQNMYILVVPIIFNKYYYNYSMTKHVIENVSTTPTLMKQIDKLIQDNVNGNIVTYLKIRNEKSKDLNPRFKFKFMKNGNYANNSSIVETGERNDNPESWSPIKELYLRYNADKDKVSDGWDNSDSVIWGDSISWMKSIKKDGKKDGKIEEPRLKYDYVFGKFTEIFTPDDKPTVITQRMKYGGIIEKLKSGEPLFILGYGASGSGKTSTLINLKDGNTSQQGILIELCNILGKDEKYENIKIKSKEYFTNINPGETTPKECNPFTDEENNNYTDIDFGNGGGGLFKCNMDGVGNEMDGVKFKWEKDKFIMNTDPNTTSKNYDSMFHQHRFTPVNNKLSSRRDPKEKTPKVGEFRRSVISPDANGNEGGGITELGEFVEYLVDRDRNVKATTNNPQSSRSHSLIYIELIKSDKGSITYETIITDNGYTRKLIENDITQEPIINGIKRKFKELEKKKDTAVAVAERLETDGAALTEDVEDDLNTITNEIDKFKKKIFREDKVHLFVGDFAGVENSFPCEKVETVKAMLQSEKDPEKYPDRGPFYSIDPYRLSGGGPEKTYKYDPTYGQVDDEKTSGELGKYLTFKQKESNFYARIFMDFGKNNNEFYGNAEGLNYDQQIRPDYKLPDINMIINIISHLLELNEGKINISNINNDIYEKIYNKIKETPVYFPDNSHILVEKIKEKARILKNKITKELNTKKTEGSSTITAEWMREESPKYVILDGDTKFWGVSKGCSANHTVTIQNNLEKWFAGPIGDIPKDAQKYWEDTKPFRVKINISPGSKTSVVQGKKIYIKNKEQIEDIINNHINGTTIIDIGNIDTEFNVIEDNNNKDILRNRKYKEDPGSNKNMGDVYVFITQNPSGPLSRRQSREEMFRNQVFGRGPNVPSCEEKVKGLTGKDWEESSASEFWKDRIVEVPGSAIVEFINKKRGEAESKFDVGKYPVMANIFEGTDKGEIEDILNIVKYTENIDYIQEILSTIVIRLSFGKLICENRLLEGKYINHSLKLVRDTISHIVSYKNRETISSFPDIVDDNCIQQYKDGAGEDCFKLKEIDIDDRYKIPSEIFQDIFKFLKISKPDYNTQIFYDELLVSVFCVLNLNDEHELNPPPTPHIDINEIKEKMYQYNISKENKENIEEEYKESIRKLINKLKYYGDDKKPGIGIKKEFLNSDYGILRKYIFDNGNVDLIDGENILTLHNAIKGVLEIIETSNAVTSIGTLEFIDKIAKYQLTETTCMGKHK